VRVKGKYYTAVFTLLILIISGCAGRKAFVEYNSAGNLPQSGAAPPRSALRHYITALNFEDDRLYQLALLEYRRALTYDPASLELREGILRNYFRLEMLDSAIVEARRILKVSPFDETAKAILGQSLVEIKDWLAAKEVYRDLTRQFPEEITYWAHLAAIDIQLQDTVQASAVYDSMAAHSTDPAEVYVRAGAVMALNNSYDSALILYRNALRLEPDNPDAYYGIAAIMIQRGLADSAEWAVGKALKANPLEPQYYLTFGFLQSRRGDLTGAEATLKQGVALAPKETRLYNLLGSVLQQAGKYTEGLEYLYRSIGLDSSSIDPYVTIGFIYDELDSLDQAAAIYERALLMDSTNALILNNYAYLLAEAGIRLEEAKAMSAASLSKEPDNPSYLDTMGWLCYRLGDYNEAERYIRKALASTENAVIYLHLGDVLRELGKYAEAEEAYHAGLNLDPEDSELKQRLETK